MPPTENFEGPPAPAGLAAHNKREIDAGLSAAEGCRLFTWVAIACTSAPANLRVAQRLSGHAGIQSALV